MNDILPTEINSWQLIEHKLRSLAASYGYQEIRMPVLEQSGLFCRGIGEITDIVEKEMYVFNDRNGDSLALRPEGTASCVRAAIEHGLIANQQTQKLWYSGPMYRHERPQKGRYRQFYQFGLEALGFAGPDIDAELIAFSWRLWNALNLQAHVVLQLNTLGTPEARSRYRAALVAYFQPHQAVLDDDCRRRLEENPLRILDSKNPELAGLIEAAPAMVDFLDEHSRDHFSRLCQLLDAVGIPYVLNPRLVRGLDYYTQTVFEWVTQDLGAQGTVCAGGRYDGLVAQLGGAETPAVGFSLGMERLILLLEQKQSLAPQQPQVYLIVVGEKAELQGLAMAEQLRQAVPALRLMMHCGGGNFKRQFKKADKSGAEIALIVGDDEIANETMTVKYLREDKPQETVKQAEIIAVLQHQWPTLSPLTA